VRTYCYPPQLGENTLRAELLHVVSVYANPIRWSRRLQLHKEFEQHMLDSGVKLTVVECAYGERPYELHNEHVDYVRVRSNSLVWNKENLMNIGVTRLPEDAKYILFCDADVEFRKPNWAAETVHALQHYSVIQPWSDAYDLGPNGEHLVAHKSFLRIWYEGHPVAKKGPNWWKWEGGPYEFGHPGYAWAFTRQALESVGGLIEIGALGAGDHHMALALIGESKWSLPSFVHNNYADAIARWERHAVKHINMRLGFLPGTIEHMWHGKKADRKYVDRWKILESNNYDPIVDIKKNTYGVVELVGNKPKLQHQIDQYFRQRNEDSNTL
jgi:hypothetical protein